MSDHITCGSGEQDTSVVENESSDCLFFVVYTDKENEIAESGIEKIKEVLFGDDTYHTLQLLACLDYYLDPYYKNRLPYEKEIYELLEQLVVSSDDDNILNEALHLISDYGYTELLILEKNFESIKDSAKPYVRYILSQP